MYVYVYVCVCACVRARMYIYGRQQATVLGEIVLRRALHIKTQDDDVT